MTKVLIHGGLYRETMRRLRLPALVMLILFTVFDLISFDSPLPTNASVAFTTIHLSLYWIPFIAPFLLTLLAFRFQSKRRESDFYHSLPFNRITLSLSMLAAIATWCAVIIIGSSVPMTSIYVINTLFNGGAPALLTFLLSAMLTTTASFLSSLFVMSLTFLASTLCGNTVSVVFTITIVWLAPSFITEALSTALRIMVPILPINENTLHPSHFNLLYADYESLAAWIGTSVLIAAMLAIGLWATKRRPSETAGSSTVTPSLQIVLRLLCALTCCLPAIYSLLVYGTCDIGIFLLAIVVYFLYELFTTRKVKNLLKAIPWLGVLAVLNLVCILTINLIATGALSFTPTPDQVDSISLISLESSHEMPYHNNHIGAHAQTNLYDEYAKNDLVTETPLFPNQNSEFYGIWSAFYEESDCRKVRVTDETCIRDACNALALSVNDLKTGYYASKTIKDNAYQKEWAVYEVQVDFHVGAVTHSRLIYLTDSQLEALLRQIDKTEPLPTTLIGYSPLL